MSGQELSKPAAATSASDSQLRSADLAYAPAGDACVTRVVVTIPTTRYCTQAGYTAQTGYESVRCGYSTNAASGTHRRRGRRPAPTPRWIPPGWPRSWRPRSRGAARLRSLLACRSSSSRRTERDMHHARLRRDSAGGRARPQEADPQFWADDARAAISERLRRREPPGPARNVVLFLGDGMSVPTMAAARTLLGQRRGGSGEEAQLSFEKFPTVGLSKTYCVDEQVADSACSATAYLCGAKANYGTVGLSAAVPRYHCSGGGDPVHHVHSIAAWALQDGRDVGIVTTTRVTHASPAGTYAHSADRDWESDADVECATPRPRDIATQLVHDYPGNQFKVILGGGRREFLPETIVDEEGTPGRRLDGRNLIEDWQRDKQARNVSYQYVWNREQLLSAATEPPEFLLGLFEGSHMQYHLQADADTEPTLAELTEVAIQALSRNERGFFLFVEGGRIDLAHHDNQAHMALDETVEFSAAVERAVELLPEEEALLVVTADHAHVMAFNGYTPRGSDILGPSGAPGDDGVPYFTLSYGNGPGFRPHAAPGVRQDITRTDYRAALFQYDALVPRDSETHGGDDVAVFARGPLHSLFAGVYEQSHIPHLMAYVACYAPPPNACQPT